MLFFQLLNVKMPTIVVGILTFYEQEKFRAQLSMKKFLQLRGQGEQTCMQGFLSGLLNQGPQNSQRGV